MLLSLSLKTLFNFVPWSDCFSKKTNTSEKLAWKDRKCKAEEESEHAYLARLERRQNYLKNPRFFPPNSSCGGKSLVVSQEKVEQVIARGKSEDNNGYALYTVS